MPKKKRRKKIPTLAELAEKVRKQMKKGEGKEDAIHEVACGLDDDVVVLTALQAELHGENPDGDDMSEDVWKGCFNMCDVAEWVIKAALREELEDEEESEDDEEG